MTTTLTNPEVVTPPVQAVRATLDSWALIIERTLPDLSVEPINCTLHAVLSFRDDDGNVLLVRKLNRPASAISQALRNATLDYHAALVTALRQGGFLPAGIDTDDIPPWQPPPPP